MRIVKFEFKVVLAYLILGFLWILFSDQILKALISDINTLSTLQTYKGWFYVGTTAFLLYVLLRNHLKMMRKAEARASENDRLKSAFLRNISHELRTPVNGILGFSELLQYNNLSQEEKINFVRIIDKSAQELLTVVDNIMDLSLIETGAMGLKKKGFDVNKMMQELYFKFLNKTKSEVCLKLGHCLPEKLKRINSDEAKIKLALNNLIDNAVKFTDEGRIKLGCYYESGQLVFFVKDTGIGLTREQQKEIFEVFGKLASGSEFKSGVGVGLNITKSIVKLLDGKMWVRSKLGEGSEFYFSIPYSSVVVKKIPLAPLSQ